MKKNDKPTKIRAFNVAALIVIALFLFGIFCTVFFVIQHRKYDKEESGSSGSMSLAEFTDPIEISADPSII